MSKFRTEFECKIDVEFLNHEKAKQFYIDNGGFNDIATVSELTELAQHLARSFQFTPAIWCKKRQEFTKFLEGFGLFININDQYVISEDFMEGGSIKVYEEQELEEVYAYQL